MQDTEIWKDIPNYEGYYQVSNQGRVRSLNRVVTNCNGSIRLIKGKLLKSFTGKHIYPTVVLSKKNLPISKRVHRLLVVSFIDNPSNKPEVNHIDGNKCNNHLSNLEWCTVSENHIHKCRVLKSGVGSQRSQSKLTENIVIDIRHKYAQGNISSIALAKKYGVSKTAILYVINRKTWTHV